MEEYNLDKAMNKNVLNAGYILFILFISLVSCLNFQSTKPQATEGFLNLAEWKIEEESPLNLSGEWEFYWEQLLVPEDFINKTLKPTCFLSVPEVWTGLTVGDEKLPAHGYATYRIIINLPESPPLLSLYIQEQGTAYRLWCNGQLLSENGRPGTTEKESIPASLPQVVFFPHESERIEIICQISNFDYRKGGMWGGITLGTDKQILQYQNSKFFLDMFLFGSLFIMMIYHLFLFLLRREDRSPLFFSLICLDICIRISVTGEMILTRFIPGFEWELLIKLEYLSYTVGMILFLQFGFSLFPKEISKRGLIIFQSILFLFTTVILIFPAVVSSHTIVPLEFFSAFYVLWGLYIMINIVRNKREGGLVFSLGCLILIITFINDILYANYIIRLFYLFPLGLFLFSLAQSYLLSMRFSSAFLQVKKLNESLERVDRLKDEFISNTSHELRTPINGINAIVKLLGKTPLNKRQKRFIRLLKSASANIINILNDILDLARIKAGKLVLKIQKFDINQLFQDTVDLMDVLAKEKGLALKLEHNKEKKCYIMGDQLRIQQILINLLSNSIKYTEHGYIRVVLKCRKLSDFTKEVTIVIEDTGIGIEQDKIKRIFLPFEQLEAGVSITQSGFGLGLTITSKLVELMNGSIELESEPGKGSCFTISLSFKEKEKDEMKLVDLASDSEKKNEKRIGKILIAEDELLNQLYLEEFLTEMGFNIDIVANGKEVLAKMNKQDYKLILLDIKMPELDGFDTAEKIREIEKSTKKHIPIIALTGYSSEQEIEKCYTCGMDDYVTKPIKEMILLEKIKKWYSALNIS